MGGSARSEKKSWKLESREKFPSSKWRNSTDRGRTGCLLIHRPGAIHLVFLLPLPFWLDAKGFLFVHRLPRQGFFFFAKGTLILGVLFSLLSLSN